MVELGRLRLIMDILVNPDPYAFKSEESGDGHVHSFTFAFVPETPPRYFHLSPVVFFPSVDSVFVCMTYEQAWVTGDESLYQLMLFDRDRGWKALRSLTVDVSSNEICGWMDDFPSGRLRNDGVVFALLQPTPAAVDASEVSAGDELTVPVTYPNPLETATTIRFQVPAQTSTSVRVYDVRGRQVATLADGERGAGWHHVSWDGTDQSGKPLPAGVYFIRVDVGSEATTTKVVLKR
jgi:hypothetical protein